MESKIKSFSFVANSRAKREAVLLIHSIRRFNDTPIYIYCDSDTLNYIESFGFDSLHLETRLDPANLEQIKKETALVTKINDFHNIAIIGCKMNCISWAVAETGNTLFIDADVVFVRDPDKSIDLAMDLMLSPHYYIDNRVSDSRKYGTYNAGYLWAGTPEVGDVWKDIYLNRSSFYEQQGMRYLPEHFNTAHFNQDHNIGFWRYPKYWKNGKVYLGKHNVQYETAISYHFHYFKETYYNSADEGLRMGYDGLRDEIIQYLPSSIINFANSL